MNDPYLKQRPIFVVDDNEDDYEAIARAFKKVGLYNPITLCTTGKMALGALKHEGPAEPQEQVENPALILLDLNMPGMDGLQVLKKIKADEKLKIIPVVIWTTSSNKYDINACYSNGANAYMQKPVAFEHLLESAKRLKEYWFETAFLPADKKHHKDVPS